MQEVQLQLEAEKKRVEEVWEELEDSEKACKNLRSELEEECKARQDSDRKLKELQENSEIDFDFAGKAGELVSWLRKTVGKALPKQVTVKEIQKILESKDN